MTAIPFPDFTVAEITKFQKHKGAYNWRASGIPSILLGYVDTFEARRFVYNLLESFERTLIA